MARTHSLRFFSALLACLVAADGLQLEQSFDQSGFSSVGSVSVHETKRGPKTYAVERNRLSDDQFAALKKAIEQDGFYTVRASKDGAHAQTSIRAACLAGPAAAEEFRLAVDGEDRPIGISYKLPSDGCSKGAAAAAALDRDWQLPDASIIRVSMAKQAPAVTMFGDDVTSMLVNQQQQAQQRQHTAGQQRQGDSEAAAGGKDSKPPEDNRSWLAKNWLFVAAFGMAILNTMLKAQGPDQGGRPAPRRQ